MVRDVRECEGHIACDPGTRSEIVVPVFDGEGVLRGVLDLDCSVVGGFDGVDGLGLERVAEVVGRGCDW